MKCQLCDTEAVIKSAKYIVEGDKSESTETTLYMQQDLVCRNPNCKNNGIVVQTVNIPIKIG